MFLNRKKLFQGKYYDNSTLILNFIWLIINIYSQLKIKIVDFFYKNEGIIFKNVDSFTINLIILIFKTRKAISYYLNSLKIDYIVNSYSKDIKQSKKIIRLLLLIYGEYYNYEHIEQKYNNSIKIAFYGENKIPDFNKADYAIGFQNLNYLDRYFKRTNLIMILKVRYFHIKNKDFIAKRNKVLNSQILNKFFAAVISNYKSSDGFRIKFIKELNKYKKVDMGGSFMNNIEAQLKIK